MKLKTKKEKYKVEDIKGSYKFTHLKFNFSFLTSNSKYNFDNKKIDKNVQADILKRICELSGYTIVQLGSLGKERGYESLLENSISISARCNNDFFKNQDRANAANNKYMIFRLYPNNNPLPARIIGKFINGVYYIFFIELEHKCYK